MAVKAAGSLIRNLAARPELKEIRLDAQIPLPSPTPAAANEPASASEWNIARTRAPEVWALSPAYNGTGAVIGSFDTGVDFTHPDLFSRYRGRSAGSIRTVNTPFLLTPTAMAPALQVQPWAAMQAAPTSGSLPGQHGLPRKPGMTPGLE